MNVLLEKLKDIINFRWFFSLKLNLLLDITELTLLQNKALFSSFCMVGRNPFDSSASFETFFRYCREVISVAKQKFNLQGRKVTENKLNPLITDLKCPRKCQSEFQFCDTSKQNFCDDSSKHV